MTPEEYVQLRAFARQDGALLSVMWIASFACYIMGMAQPLLGMTAIVLAVLSPFYAATRLRQFRDTALDGIISFARCYGYIVMTFFYAGLLLAAAIFVYFTFIDDGYLLSQFTQMLANDETRRAMQLYGLDQQMEQSLQELAELRPIDYALNMLVVNIMTGAILGPFIAALMQRKPQQS